MGINYDPIKNFEYSLHIHSYKQFSEQIFVFDEMMELYLEPLEETKKYWHFVDSRSAAVMLLARIFNNCEAARLLLLNGLPEQAMMPMRDIVESMMLFRLFGVDSKLAKRWMQDLKEYHPATVKKKLDQLGIDCEEYKLYSMLSQMTHPNLLAAVMKVTEHELTHDVLVRTYNFGGMNKPSWIRSIFISLLILMLMTLMFVLPPAYFPKMKNPNEWWDKVITIKDHLVRLGADIQISEVKKTGKDRAVQEQVFNRLKVDYINFKPLDKAEIESDPGFSI
ncbi:hypothetical protein ACFLTJ_03290 [Chloroflexota bacterium]